MMYILIFILHCIYLHVYVLYIYFNIICNISIINIANNNVSMYVCACALSCVRLSATSWTATHQAPLFIGFPRQEYWSGLPLPSQGDLPDPGIKPTSLASPALAGDSVPAEPSGKLVH